MIHWAETHKGDARCRVLADGHYSRQTPGHRFFTRPGFNYVLYYEQKNGRAAVWVWWRPKWEAGIERFDGLRAIECTLFRNQTRVRSSDLIREAVTLLPEWNRISPHPDGLITGVNSMAVIGGLHPDSFPGHCYHMAGWEVIPGKKSPKADKWYRCL